MQITKTGAPLRLGRPDDGGRQRMAAVVPPGRPVLTSTRSIQRVAKRASARAHPDYRSLPSQQFQALFDSLFKVLFIFPSRYLFAIGLPPVFSLRWDLPPALGCIPKQPDSTKPPRGVTRRAPTGFSPSTTPLSRGLGRTAAQRTVLQTTSRRPRVGDFHTGLFPVRSPLLGESWLVYFPLLIDMLKFRR